MQSVRYIAFCIKKFKDKSFYGKYISSVNKRTYHLIKQNIRRIVKFSSCLIQGEFGFFYCVNIFKHCFFVGCRSPPNQFESKKLKLIGGNYGEITKESICFRKW